MNQLFLQIEERIKFIKHFHDDGEVAVWLGFKKANYSRRKKRNSIPYKNIINACKRDLLSYDYVVSGKGEPVLSLPVVNLINRTDALRPDVATVIHAVTDIMYSGQGEIIDALVRNVQEFKRATETAKRLNACEIELKDLKDEVSGLKKQIDRLTAPPTGAGLKAG